LRRPPGSVCLALLISLFSLVGATLGQAQSKGDGSLRLEYQYIRTGTFDDGENEYDYWTTDAQVLMLSGDYAFTDRWTVFGALPYIWKRFNPGDQFNGDPHNPNDPYWVDFVPPDKRLWDDGDYHSDFQDVSVGISYLALDGPLSISPYIGYGAPVTNYPFFAKAAIGLNLWNIPVGVSFSYVPYLSDWYMSGNVAYVFSEQPLDVNVDYWLAQLSAGYWFKPGFSVNVFLDLKYVRNGLKLPWDFVDDPNNFVYPDEFGTEEWWHHDQLIAHRNLNLGLGVDYFLTRKWKVSATGYTAIWVEQTNKVDYAFTMALTRFFSKN
jgi:hypothetical protein